MTHAPPLLAENAPTERDPRRLLVAIHDVASRHESEVDQLGELIAAAGATQVAMLVVPNFWGNSPIVPGSGFAARLRHWAEGGVEMFLHGLLHRDRHQHRAWLTRMKARHMTAGEGEFLGLTVEHHQALNPAEHPQGGRQRLPRAIEPIEDTEEVGENLRRGVLLVEVTIELNATLEVGEVGLGALPAVEVLGSTGLGITNRVQTTPASVAALLP